MAEARGPPKSSAGQPGTHRPRRLCASSSRTDSKSNPRKPTPSSAPPPDCLDERVTAPTAARLVPRESARLAVAAHGGSVRDLDLRGDAAADARRDRARLLAEVPRALSRHQKPRAR